MKEKIRYLNEFGLLADNMYIVRQYGKFIDKLASPVDASKNKHRLGTLIYKHLGERGLEDAHAHEIARKVTKKLEYKPHAK